MPARSSRGMAALTFGLTLLANARTGAQVESCSLARAGEFVWLEGKAGHTTAAIRALAPHVDFVFLETAHFRIGSSLAPHEPSGSQERKLYQADLNELRRLGYRGGKGPRAGHEQRALVYALRLERLYADVAERLGVTDAEFAAEVAGRGDPRYVGEGPYFGMRQRLLVLLCQEEADLERYCAAFVGRRVTHDGLRHFFRDPGTQFFGAAARGQHIHFEDDRALHAAVVYSVTHVLVDAFKYHWHETPLWLQEGLAHWQRRRVAPDAELFTFLPRGLPEKNRALDWAASMRLRVQHGNFTPLRDALLWLEDQTLDYGDHLAVWSRVDFLLREHPVGFGKLVRAVKGPEARGAPLSPNPEQIARRQLDALETVFGWTPDAFDEAWCAFVKAKYPRR